jgi:phytoene dehydrogenase-like protein
MLADYDAIVIGAGMGGLAAAARMARLGNRVLLLERHTVPGGYGSSFVRGRFEFEIALHQISPPTSGGSGRPFGRVLEGLGVLDRIDFHPLPLFYRSWFPDFDLRVPAGSEGFLDALCGAFPHEADGIRTVVELMMRVSRQLELAGEAVQPADGSGLSPLRAAALPVRARSLLRYSGVSVDDVLGRHIQDPQARAVITQTWGYYGMPPSELSFLYFAAGTGTFIEAGPAYVRQRSQGLSSALVAVVEEHGGSVRMGCGARHILQQSGRISGVVTDRDEHIRAPVVISNASPLVTCRELMDPDMVPGSFWRRLRSTTVGPSSLNVYLGLDRPGAELGLVDNDQWINDGYDADAVFRDMHSLDDPSLMMLTAHSHDLPELAPPGCATLTLTTLYYAEPWLRLEPSRYHETKRRIAASMLAKVEARFPGLRDSIEEIEISTPITNMRYTGQPGGAIYGFDQPPAEAIIWRIPNQGPIPGLYFAGAWTLPGGGFEPTLCSGYNAACLASSWLESQKAPRLFGLGRKEARS